MLFSLEVAFIRRQLKVQPVSAGAARRTDLKPSCLQMETCLDVFLSIGLWSVDTCGLWCSLQAPARWACALRVDSLLYLSSCFLFRSFSRSLCINYEIREQGVTATCLMCSMLTRLLSGELGVRVGAGVKASAGSESLSRCEERWNTTWSHQPDKHGAECQRAAWG